MPYTVYLAGPMTNRPQFNFPQFHVVTAVLRLGGWDVLSPAEKDLEKIPWERMQTIPGFQDGDLAAYTANCEFDMGNAMEWDLPAIQRSDGIVLLPEWETSTGARWERTVAEAMNRDIWLADHDGIGWGVSLDLEPKRITNFLKGFTL